ncbi:hypothetical protein A3D03_03425 [Candidatus Gottesmanbacteria bacterium RIFCSPHIGHO2_02_FULL_40_13]|uniref:Uncharacterized protein n=1 Tax=Candidatus Gottesmanbacteria bacterium RIFCSPHIGHO2_02_FULL_40_13 TaxID=1798384 RepID=A0A1F6AC67_9BACT|nr:MAG: hypothetical protein A3D03_03425 [Candidatus Gottesmanbacteria bacterium RIFCSPHIGHO2_02_FULL_40_13]
MTKYQQYYQDMVDNNWKTFTAFKNLHDRYVKEPEVWHLQFNSEGENILKTIREWERRLCNQTEKGQYSKFSSSLADKFWELVRADYPKIDFVGVKY